MKREELLNKYPGKAMGYSGDTDVIGWCDCIAIMTEYATHIAKEALKQHGISDTVAHYTIEKLLKDNQ